MAIVMIPLLDRYHRQTHRYGETDRGTETDRDRAMRYRERQNRQI